MIGRLEEVLGARRGAYLLIPSTSYWWLDFYSGLKDYLERMHHCVVDDPDLGALFRLNETVVRDDCEEADNGPRVETLLR